MLPGLRRLISLQYRGLVNELSLFKIVKLWKCSWLLPHEQAICFGSLIWLSRNKSVQKSRFSRIVKNSREFSLLDLDLEAFWFHFSLLEKEWKHFDFTLHFSKKSESIFFHFALLEKEWKLFIFTFHFSNFKNPLSLVPVVWACAKQLVAHAHDKECRITCDKYQSIYLRQCFRPWDAHVQLAIDVRDKTFKANNSTRREVQKLLKHHTGSSKPCWQDWPKKEVETNLLKFILVHILNKHINAAWNR